VIVRFGGALAFRAALGRNCRDGRVLVPPSPYVYVDGRPVGDMGTLRALAVSGQLERLLREDL
jgi:hypothetical protein